MSSEQPKNELQPTCQFDQAAVLFTVINGEIAIKTFGDGDAFEFADFVAQLAKTMIENQESIIKNFKAVKQK